MTRSDGSEGNLNENLLQGSIKLDQVSICWHVMLFVFFVFILHALTAVRFSTWYNVEVFCQDSRRIFHIS